MEHLSLENQVKSIKRKMTFLSFFSIGLICLIFVMGFKSQNKFDTISVSRINLTDESGNVRFVFAAPLPNPRVGGKEFKRSTDVYGIQFLDPDGNEVGGLGVEDSHNTRMLCFDYATAEALCIAKSNTFVGMNIIGSPKPGASVGKPGPERISMGVTDKGNSFLKLSDNNGKERIAFTIDSENIVRISVLDENGTPVFQIPEKK